jgi:hypothetical protein
MTDLTATQARSASTTDQVIYNEIDTVTRAILVAALAGELTTVVADGTIMTDSTPTITVTGTVTNPVVGVTDESLVIAGETITLSANNDVDQIVATINDAMITGLVANKNVSQQVVIVYDPLPTAWSLIVSAGAGADTVGITVGSETPPTPSSVAYHSVWSGQETDRKKSYEYAQVVQHFQNLGYSIIAKKNTDTVNTLKWELYW